MESQTEILRAAKNAIKKFWGKQKQVFVQLGVAGGRGKTFGRVAVSRHRNLDSLQPLLPVRKFCRPQRKIGCCALRLGWKLISG